MEILLLEKDIRIMNAKVRLQERLRRHRESDGDEAAGREAKIRDWRRLRTRQ